MSKNTQEDQLEQMRHSCAHLLAAAVVKLWPNTKLGIGPAITDGFYYDFQFKKPISEEDLPKIEFEMREVLGTWQDFEREEKSINEAKKIERNQPFKLDLIREFAKTSKKVSFYKSGDFLDLCKGGHVKKAKEIGPFKLLSIAGAYWRGSEKNPMLTRIYGICFENQKKLDEYLENREKSKQNDHKKIGQELELFTFLPQAPGMPFWYPKGLVIVNKLKEFIRGMHTNNGYAEISTPLLAKKEVWDTSGHWKLFKEDMFVFAIEKQSYSLKPMNCPETLILYKTRRYSYKDLPLKWSCLDVLHRNENSGTLNGLFRVRELTQDDGHIICSPEQAEQNIREVLEMSRKVFKVFGLIPHFYLSTKPEKALGNTKLWDEAQKKLESALKKEKVSFEIKPKEGSFYGPKIDLHIEDSLGRDWQLSTLQLDVQMPKSFGATYVDKDGKEKTPVMIHKALFGSIERFIGILVEHFGGAFPTWLAPVQVKILPIADRHASYAKKVYDEFQAASIRVELDDRNETLQSKIRDAQVQKIPYMLIVGDKERVQKKVALRSREKGDEGVVEIKEVVEKVKKEETSFV
jgi:threonyl-tRNA synthetase